MNKAAFVDKALALYNKKGVRFTLAELAQDLNRITSYNVCYTKLLRRGAAVSPSSLDMR